ncbi:MAG: PDZ domain-containing protein, partial [Gammaproteobacteria bacterium]|nr:PDZ domain-containing protein [Gammaproteobacteria bacterium]
PEDDEVQAKAREPARKTTNRIRITVSELSDEDMESLEIEQGVVVDHVTNGAASRAGVRKGDIILSVDNTAVKSVKQFQSMIDKLPDGKSVALLVQRGGSPTFLALKIPES